MLIPLHVCALSLEKEIKSLLFSLSSQFIRISLFINLWFFNLRCPILSVRHKCVRGLSCIHGFLINYFDCASKAFLLRAESLVFRIRFCSCLELFVPTIIALLGLLFLPKHSLGFYSLLLCCSLLFNLFILLFENLSCFNQ